MWATPPRSHCERGGRAQKSNVSDPPLRLCVQGGVRTNPMMNNVPKPQKLSYGVGSSPKTIDNVSKIAENLNATGTPDLKISPLSR